MPATTACRRYPYPIDADPPNVAVDIGKLAIAIDADACTLAGRLGNSEAVALNAVKRAGDTMTGSLAISSSAAWQLALRRTGTGTADKPTLSFQSVSGTPQFGTIMGDPTGLTYKVDSTADRHALLVGTVERLVVDAGGADLTGALNVKGSIEAQNPGGNQLYLVDNNGGRNCYLSLYGDGTATATGAQSAAIGFNGSSRLMINNVIANGEVYISTQGNGPITLTTEAAGDISLSCGAGGEINFTPNGGFQGKMMTNGVFLWGKAAVDEANAGLEFYGAGTAEGMVRSTVEDAGFSNLTLRRQGGASTDGAHIIDFKDGSTATAWISMDKTAPVGVNFANVNTSAPSDYRLKDVIGDLSGALRNIVRLRPITYTWKGVPGGLPLPGFLAHEVAEVVPSAVHGVQDGPEMQQLDATKLVPLLTAAIIELLERVEALEADHG